MQSVWRMRNYYRAVITSLSDRLWFDKDGVHKMFKIWFRKKTTSWMSHTEWYDYIENVLDFIQEVRGRRYDSEWYKYESISYYDMPYAMIDKRLLE